MTKFNVNGDILETAEDLNLQFSKKNILFAFDDAECERSTSFTIPATSRNNRILELAGDIHTSGTKMRQKLECQMQHGIAVYDGYLYITSYDIGKREYECVFVFGSLRPLLDLKNRGPINSWFTTDASCVWDGEYNTSSDQLWKTYLYPTRYYIGIEQVTGWHIYRPFPSIGIDSLLNGVISQAGYTAIPYSWSRLRWIPDKLIDAQGNNVIFGSTAYLANNLPDIDAIELLKTICYTAGDLPYSDGVNVGVYQHTSWSEWGKLELKDIVQVGMEKRTVEGFAQKSYMKYNVGDLGYDTIQGVAVKKEYKPGYSVQNEYIESENVLHEAGQYCSVYETGGYVDEQHTYVTFAPQRGDYHEDYTYYDAKKQVMIAFADRDQYGVNLSALKRALKRNYTDQIDNAPYWLANSIVSNICSNSTQVQVSVRMSLYEYDRMSDKTLIYWNGCNWVWFAAEWGNNVAKLTLQKTTL